MEREFSCRVLLITGEISGDVYGYFLIKRIKEIDPSIHFIGIGGPKIRSLGIESLFSAESLALVGIPKISELKKYWYVYKRIEDILKRRKVDVVVLVDFPGFNLKIAKLAKKLGYPVIYYIAPQIWAWHRNRIKILKKCVDRLYVILPFEKKFFESYGITTIFLGHPILDIIKTNLSPKMFFEIYHLDEKKPLISFFPGSRENEIKRHIPLFLKVFKRLKAERPDIQGIMVKTSGLSENMFWDMAREHIKVIEGGQYEILNCSKVALLASGTITLESAIIGIPAVVTYSLPYWMYFIAKKLIKVPYISLPNLILQKEVYPEILEEKNKIERLSQTILKLIENKEIRENIKEDLAEIKKKIGPLGASWRIAEDIVRYILSLRRIAFRSF